MGKIIIIILIFFFGMYNYKSEIKTTRPVENREYREEYIEEEKEETETTEYSNINKISVSTLQSKVNNKEDFILVITGTTCPHCMNYKPDLNSVMKSYSLTAYEIDAWVLDADEKNKLIETVGEFSGVPFTAIIKNGEVVDSIIGAQRQSTIISKLNTSGFIN